MTIDATTVKLNTIITSDELKKKIPNSLLRKQAAVMMHGYYPLHHATARMR